MSINEPRSSTRRDVIKTALVGAATVAAPATAAADGQSNRNFRLYDPDKLPPSTGFS